MYFVKGIKNTIVEHCFASIGETAGDFCQVRDSYPKMPIGYFDAGATAMLAAFRERALREADIDLLSSFPAITEEALTRGWQGWAIQVYAN